MTIGVILIGIGIVLYIWLGKEIDQGMEPNANGSADYMIILGAKVRPVVYHRFH